MGSSHALSPKNESNLLSPKNKPLSQSRVFSPKTPGIQSKHKSVVSPNNNDIKGVCNDITSQAQSYLQSRNGISPSKEEDDQIFRSYD
jgi:hypothetical protein